MGTGFPSDPQAAPGSFPPPGGMPAGGGAYPPPPFEPLPPPGYGPPPRRKSKAGWWIGGCIAALLLACCLGGVLLATVGGGMARVVGGIASNTTAAQAAARGYYDAVGAHDWNAAQGYLSSSLRQTVSANGLQTIWSAREAANGRVTGFTTTNTSIATNNGRTTATITGRVQYERAAAEQKTVQLVKEGNDWKLSSLP